jgi:toxin-antitoxin system PIN domain toxin
MRTLDVNVLIYAVDSASGNHAPARRCVEDALNKDAGLGFTWPALTGFLRLVTRPGVLRKPLPIEQALSVVDEWLSHPRARVISPGERHAGILGRLLIGIGAGGNWVPDAHLAAIAIEHGLELASFDRDFERFAGLRLHLMRT